MNLQAKLDELYRRRDGFDEMTRYLIGAWHSAGVGKLRYNSIQWINRIYARLKPEKPPLPELKHGQRRPRPDIVAVKLKQKVIRRSDESNWQETRKHYELWRHGKRIGVYRKARVTEIDALDEKRARNHLTRTEKVIY